MTMRDALAEEPYLRGRQIYVRAPRPIAFPTEEEVPETKRHLEARPTLYLLLKEALTGTAIGSEQFVYWDAGDPQKCLAPDVFTKGGSPNDGFDTWKVWERGAPDLAVEIVSASDRRDADWTAKLTRYQASGITEVARFDPMNASQPLRIWDRIDGELLERSPESTLLRECVALGLWWVVVPSAYGPMLRIARDRDGEQLLPTPSEERLRLAEELGAERKARTLAEHERALAEQERALAEQERTLAEQERTRAEQERTRAEQERMRAEQERTLAKHELSLAEQKLREVMAAHERERAAVSPIMMMTFLVWVMLVA